MGGNQRQRSSEANTTHGYTSKGQTRPTYHTWASMIKRCTNKNSKHWKNYGARGIKICDRWFKFEAFLEDMGDKPLGKSIERIDNNGNYEPGNCTWATQLEQTNNQRKNRRLEFNGKTMTVAQWAREIGMPVKRLEKRLKYGWSVERALTAHLHGITPQDSIQSADK